MTRRQTIVLVVLNVISAIIAALAITLDRREQRHARQAAITRRRAVGLGMGRSMPP